MTISRPNVLSNGIREESDGEGAGSRVVKELPWEIPLLRFKNDRRKLGRRRISDKRMPSTLKQTGTFESKNIVCRLLMNNMTNERISNIPFAFR